MKNFISPSFVLPPSFYSLFLTDFWKSSQHSKSSFSSPSLFTSDFSLSLDYLNQCHHFTHDFPAEDFHACLRPIFAPELWAPVSKCCILLDVSLASQAQQTLNWAPDLSCYLPKLLSQQMAAHSLDQPLTNMETGNSLCCRHGASRELLPVSSLSGSSYLWAPLCLFLPIATKTSLRKATLPLHHPNLCESGRHALLLGGKKENRI